MGWSLKTEENQQAQKGQLGMLGNPAPFFLLFSRQKKHLQHNNIKSSTNFISISNLQKMSNAGGGGGGGVGGGALPTGCYKCGRPGHWSRDCPFSAPSNPSSNSASSADPKSLKNNPGQSANFSKSGHGSSFQTKAGAAASSEKPKKVPKTRPKLTPELLLSDQGIGYILRYFPRNFKCRGRGHEVLFVLNLALILVF